MKKQILTLIIGIISINGFAQIPSYVPTNGLVGWWPFNGNANDESGNNNNGIVTGALLSSDRNGSLNSAYSFDGTGDYIDCGNSGSINIIGDITTSSWINANNFNIDHGIISKLGLYDLVTNSPYTQPPLNKLRWNAGNVPFLFSNVISANQWLHVVTVYSQTNGKSIYLNGVLFATDSQTGTVTPNTSNNLYIGAHQPTIVNYWSWNGLLDDIGIWNRAISQQEITNLYNSQSCQTPIATITPQGNTTICQGNSVNLNASIGIGYNYEWYKDGNIINNSTSSSYLASQSGNYTVKVINGSCNATSNATIVTVNPNPLALISPQSSTTFCQGGSVILNGSTGIGYNYEWYIDGNIINGAITNVYTANQSGSYTVKVIDGSCYAVSSFSSVTVNPNPTVSLSLANLIHLKEASVSLAGSPSGGIYTGPGVVGNIFNSINAGLGKKVIYYNYTSTAGCSGSATAITTVYDTVACSTFDTLFINVAVVGLNAPNNIGTLKVWPNPANDHIIIDNGNIALLSGYKVKIESILGQEVFKSSINQQQFSVDLSTWSGKGVYLVHVIDNQDNIIVTKKIVLQ